MAAAREKSKGRRSTGRFAGIPHHVMKHPDYIASSNGARSLLLEFSLQFNGHNNGDLSAAFSVLKKRGFKSKTTLAKALRELEHRDLIRCSRPWRFLNPGSQCALFALTWLAVDECPGKGLELKPTRAPLRSFTAEIIKMPGPETVTSGTSFCDQRGQKHA